MQVFNNHYYQGKYPKMTGHGYAVKRRGRMQMLQANGKYTTQRPALAQAFRRIGTYNYNAESKLGSRPQ